MSITVRQFSAQVKDPSTGNMIPAGLLSSDALGAIDTAKNTAITAIQAQGATTIASIPSDYTSLSNEVDDLKNAITTYNCYDTLADVSWPNHNWQGVQFTWDGEKYTASGTSTAAGNYNVYSSTSELPGGIQAGDLLIFEIKSTFVNVSMYLFFYVNGAWGSARILVNDYQTIVPDGTTGMMIRFRVEAANKTVSGTCRIEAIRTMSNQMFENIPVILPNETIEATGTIQAALAKYGIVQLSKGTFKIADLQMPDNSILRGCGESTILSVDSTAHSGANGVKPGANCTIENLRITCNAGHTGSRGTGSGIYIEGNYSDSPYKYNTKINNATIDGFPDGGVHGKATGYWYANSISATNLKIVNCYAGILLEDFCEYNRFTNCLCYNNYIGAAIPSGNNVLVNCSLSGNTVGMYLDDSNSANNGNNGHGAIIGCTLNHNNNNEGYAIIVKGVTNGFIIDGCNIWYGKILSDAAGGGSAGLLISYCLFGGGTPEIDNWGGALLLNACLFKAAPTFKGNTTTNKIACYLFDGTPVT